MGRGGVKETGLDDDVAHQLPFPISYIPRYGGEMTCSKNNNIRSFTHLAFPHRSPILPFFFSICKPP